MRRMVFLLLLLAGLVGFLVMTPLTASASHQFTDVPDTNIFHNDIGWLADHGITTGCNPPVNDRFCPDDSVTRGEMAVFLVRAMGYNDKGGGNLFIDDDGLFYEEAADKLAAAGVTQGCNPPANDRFCGSDKVTRGQMAALLVRAMSFTYDGGGDLFTDDDGHLFENAIDKLGAAKVTQGCNPPVNDQFCPNDSVTRGQMAAFLKRTLSPVALCDQAPVSEQECLALIALYEAFGIEPPKNADVCAGYGVVCEQGGVVRLTWAEQHLTGSIPPEIGDLFNLQYLNLYYNQITGPIPPEIGNLTDLRNLSLSRNDFTGPIPPEIGNLTNLRYLSLGFNGLTGPIPPEIGNLTNLRNLSLVLNDLSGPIPPEIGNLTNLYELHLTRNLFSGPIPPEIGNLANLSELDLGFNQISGWIPPEIGNLTNLYDLRLYNNQFTGPIPPEIGNLTNLQYLLLFNYEDEPFNNQFTGPIPPEIGNLTNLYDLRLYNNQFTGPIPPEIGNLTNLKYLHLHDNRLSGDVPKELQTGTSVDQLSLHGQTGCLSTSDAGLETWLAARDSLWNDGCDPP